MDEIFYIANWKMNKTVSESNDFFDLFLREYKMVETNKIVFCPSFISLSKVSDLHILNNSKNISFGAQNVSNKSSGAYTGEISVDMLKDTCASYCIVGHSERRSVYKESDSIINEKLKLLIKAKITPILCIGESWEEREKDEGEKAILHQLSCCLKGLDKSDIIIAYEPIWAIGTGQNASVNDISNMNIVIKNHMNRLGYIDEQFYILYGGSVDIDNVNVLKSAEYINGFLIGGASLMADNFLKLIKR